MRSNNMNWVISIFDVTTYLSDQEEEIETLSSQISDLQQENDELKSTDYYVKWQK